MANGRNGDVRPSLSRHVPFRAEGCRCSCSTLGGSSILGLSCGLAWSQIAEGDERAVLHWPQKQRVEGLWHWRRFSNGATEAVEPADSRAYIPFNLQSSRTETWGFLFSDKLRRLENFKWKWYSRDVCRDGRQIAKRWGRSGKLSFSGSAHVQGCWRRSHLRRMENCSAEVSCEEMLR